MPARESDAVMTTKYKWVISYRFANHEGFPDLKKISSDLFLPNVESIDADISNGRLRSLTTSLINNKVYFTHQILTKIFQQ